MFINDVTVTSWSWNSRLLLGIKFPTKRIFRIFYIWKTNKMMLFCNIYWATLVKLDKSQRRKNVMVSLVVSDCAVPPAPSDVQVLSRHSHSIVVGWQAPYPPHGVITQYLLKYRRHNMHHGVPFLIVLPPTSFKYNISALKPNVVYDVQVLVRFAYNWLLHRVPKLAAPLLQTRLIWFVIHGFKQNIVHCTIVTLLTVTPIMTYALYRVCSM